VADGAQPAVDEMAPHLAGEPDRVESDRTHPRLDEHVSHRVVGHQREHLGQVGLAQHAQRGHPQHVALLLPAHFGPRP